MIAFLPLWILGVPLVLALIDLMAMRSGVHDVDYDTPATRDIGFRRELRRGEESSPVVGRPIHQNRSANIS